MIDALPTVKELENADDDTVDAAYAAVQDACDALDELSTEELEQITGLDKLEALMEWLPGWYPHTGGKITLIIQKPMGKLQLPV